MEPSAVEAIAVRLSAMDDLYYPGAFNRSSASSPSPSPSSRKETLLNLLHRDVPIFLERYGAILTAEERQSFEPLRGNYEVNYHLQRLSLSPLADKTMSISAARNRRRAYMEKLVKEGEYFSEDAMREREPYLHYEYLGRFQDWRGRAMARPGERWSETLMRRADEAAIIERVREEQKRRRVDPREWIGAGEEDSQEIEVEEEEEEDNDDDLEEKENGEEKSGVAAAEPSVTPAALSAEEMQEQLEQFTCVMQHKFMSGEDTEYQDYSAIDSNERLDEHWSREANCDAEEKYFEGD